MLGNEVVLYIHGHVLKDAILNYKDFRNSMHRIFQLPIYLQTDLKLGSSKMVL